MVSLLQRVTFSKRRKGNPKGFAPAYGTSLRLSVPSLRCPSGGIASGLLRCTSSRCMRLRRMALRAYPLMDTFARPAEGAEDQKPHQKPHQKPKPKQIKRSHLSAVPTWDWVFSFGVWSADRPPSRASPLPQWIGLGSWRLVGWSAAIAGRPAPTIGPSASARDWSAVRPPSPAGWLLQFRERAPLAAKPPHSTQ